MIVEPNFTIAEQIATVLSNAKTDHNEVAKASAYLNHIGSAEDFFTWLQWMATPDVSQRLARSRQTPEYYKQMHRACQQLKSLTDEKGKSDVKAMAQTLAWTVRLMRYYPVAKPVTPERALTQQPRPSPARSQPTPTVAGTRSLNLGDLRPGMALPGTVKRIADFGAFVDIGVGRDGLVHISRLRAERVGRVDDVVQPGQAVTVWVLEVDAGQGRIGLTMVRPPQTAAPEVIAPKPEPPAKPVPAPRPAAVRVSSVDEVKPGLWVLGTVTKVDLNRLVIDIGLAEGASLTFDRLPGQPTDRDEVAETWPAGTELEARVVNKNPRGRVQLALK